jgi:4'-phosphopantetheinyl transferase
MEVVVGRNADNLTSSTWVSGRRASRSVPTRGSVHLWHGTAKPGRTDVDDADLPLSDDELTRAHGMASMAARCMFVATHTALRNVLSRYLDRDPRDLQFAYGPHGKPYLALPTMKKMLHFNVSHSGRVFGIAIASDGEVGFDIEWIDRSLSISLLIEQVMGPAERSNWQQVPAEFRHHAFFYYWTRKEALLKARGRGLTVDPRTLEVAEARVQGHVLRSGVPRLGYIDCVAAPWEIASVQRRWLTGAWS